MKLALDPDMFRITPLLGLSSLVADPEEIRRRTASWEAPG